MVKAAEEVVEKVKSGELTGVMFVAASAGGGGVTGVYGAFADRLQYAIYATTKHLDALVTRAANSPGVGHTHVHGGMEGRIPTVHYKSCFGVQQ